MCTLVALSFFLYLLLGCRRDGLKMQVANIYFRYTTILLFELHIANKVKCLPLVTFQGDVLLDLNLAQTIANQLVNEAVHRGSDDNVSAIIVLFRFHGDETSSLARSKEATVADNLPPTENVPKSSHIPAEGCNGSTDSINTST